jgi:hypothetical protein
MQVHFWVQLLWQLYHLVFLCVGFLNWSRNWKYKIG